MFNNELKERIRILESKVWDLEHRTIIYADNGPFMARPSHPDDKIAITTVIYKLLHHLKLRVKKVTPDISLEKES